MSARLMTLLGLDARLQLRYGIYYAYAFVVAVYVAALIYGAPYLPVWAAGVFVYTDPAVLGFFFLGALMMLEKGEGTRSALAMTPISVGEYVLSKTMTLSTVSLIAVTVIGLLIHTNTNWAVLLPATLLTSIFFIGIGVPIALHFKSVTSYLIGSAGYLLPMVVPAGIALFDPMPAWAILIPWASQLNLIQIGLGKSYASGWEIAGMFAVIAITALAGNRYGVHSLSKELGRR